MNQLKKNLFWIIAGVILLGEVAFGVLSVKAQYSASDTRRSNLERARKRLSNLVKAPDADKTLANEEIIKEVTENRRAVENNTLNVVLFLLERDHKIEQIMPPPPDGNPYDLNSTERASRVEQYSTLVSKLRQKAENAGIELGNQDSIMQASWGGSVPTPAQLSDAFKSYWLQKACVEAMIPAEEGGTGSDRVRPLVGKINDFAFPGGSGSAGGLLGFHTPPGGNPKYGYVPIKIEVSMLFEHLPALVSRLLQSRTLMRFRGIEMIKSQTRTGPGAGATGDDAAPKGDPRQVNVTIRCEALDFNLRLQKVAFDTGQFKGQAEVRQWLAAQRSKLGTSLENQARRFLLERVSSVTPTQGEAGLEYVTWPADRIVPGTTYEVDVDAGVKVFVGIQTR